MIKHEYYCKNCNDGVNYRTYDQLPACPKCKKLLSRKWGANVNTYFNGSYNQEYKR